MTFFTLWARRRTAVEGVYTIDAQTGIVALTGADADLVYTPATVYTIDAQPGVVYLLGADVEFVHTPVAPVVPIDTGGGGMAWPVPQRVRRLPKRTPRVPVLVHRTIEARAGRTILRGGGAFCRFRRALVAEAGVLPLTGTVAVCRFRRAAVAAGVPPIPATPMAGFRFRRLLGTAWAGPVPVLGVTLVYRAAIVAEAGQISLVGAAQTADKSLNDRIQQMFADDEWLLMEVA
jgi:hypothetical protein